jgi:hypothetical protein
MNRFFILSFFAFALPAHAADDQAKPRRLLQISPATHNTLAGDGTWGGFVNVSARPCPDGPVINTNIGFSGVKTSDEIFDKIATQLDGAEHEAEQIEEHCKK